MDSDNCSCDVVLDTKDIVKRQDQLDRKEHAFAWKNISLNIKTNDGKKSLLDGMDGELEVQR